jgi:hypothetical protein
MDQQVFDNKSVSQHYSQGLMHEGGDQENDQEASKAQLFGAGEGAVEVNIPADVENEDQATKAIQDWMKDSENREFVAKHTYTGKWNHDPSAKGTIAVQFKKTDGGFNDMTNKPGGKRASPLRNGGTSINYMRSTNYTANPPAATAPPEAPLGASQGLWRSYYAQQRDVSRERELSANAERYRMSHHVIRGASGSPIRSHSPPPPHVVEHVNIARYAPAFSHYEQHREQREQREHIEHQKIQ